MKLTRRSFSQTSLAAILATQSAPYLARGQAARRFRVVLIGAGWWGTNLLHTALDSGVCDLAALCDVDERMLALCGEALAKRGVSRPKGYKDFRECLATEKPDIALIATPDHWHALPMIEACRQGAHVYVEKPICHTILEGRAMVAAAARYGRVVQVGTHRRASPHNQSAREFIRSGKLGPIGFIRCFVTYSGGPEKPKRNIEPPRGLDWDFWCGPAPLRPFCGDLKNPWSSGIHPRGFRHFMDYANGQLGDWGIHWLDQVLWITGLRYPNTCHSVGGRPIRGPAILTQEEQTTDAPDMQVVTWAFADGPTVTWEHRLFAGNPHERGENVGVYFHGQKGVLHLGWQQGWTFYPSNRKEPVLHEDAQLNEPDGQNLRELFADFLDAIRTGRKPLCDIESGHQATTMCLLGNLAMKHGRSVSWDGAKETTGEAAADALLRRPYRGAWTYPVAP
ncbi:MAG TPA: Gfo/Idh/MocA family oxidoreductase [Kiritimatiellia bacterium]|nr:Gfo/Idh/MocA family oxidoreductase [Kiritimatiellia bacterium]